MLIMDTHVTADLVVLQGPGLLVDCVYAEVDGGPEHRVEVARVVAHRAVTGRVCRGSIRSTLTRDTRY